MRFCDRMRSAGQRGGLTTDGRCPDGRAEQNTGECGTGGAVARRYTSYREDSCAQTLPVVQRQGSSTLRLRSLRFGT